MCSTVSIRPSQMDSPMGFSQALHVSVSQRFTMEPLLLPPHFFHYNSPSLLQRMHKISIGPDKPPHIIFFCIWIFQQKSPQKDTCNVSNSTTLSRSPQNKSRRNMNPVVRNWFPQNHHKQNLLITASKISHSLF